MKNKRYSNAQIMGILQQAESGVPVSELCQEHGMRTGIFYKWRAKFGGMNASMILETKAVARALNMSWICTLRFANGLPEGEESEFIERLLAGNQNQKHVCQDAVYYNHFTETFRMWIKITLRERLCRYRISKRRLDHKAFHRRNLIKCFISLSILALPVTYFTFVCLYIARVLSSLSTTTRTDTQKKLMFSAFCPLFFYSRRFGWLSAFLKDEGALAIRRDADYTLLSVITVLRGHKLNA